MNDYLNRESEFVKFDSDRKLTAPVLQSYGYFFGILKDDYEI